MLKSDTSIRFVLDLLVGSVLVAANYFNVTNPCLGNVATLKILKGDVVSSTHIVWG